MVLDVLENLLETVENCLCMYFSLMESVIIIEFHKTEAYSSFNLAQAKYSISKLSTVEKKNCELTLQSLGNLTAK
jgi:hypothetical protein